MQIPTSFVFMVRKNSFPAIKYGEEPAFRSGIMFKWLAVLYVDPQNLMTNRRNPSFGNGCRFRGKNNAGNKV